MVGFEGPPGISNYTNLPKKENPPPGKNSTASRKLELFSDNLLSFEENTHSNEISSIVPKVIARPCLKHKDKFARGKVRRRVPYYHADSRIAGAWCHNAFLPAGLRKAKGTFHIKTVSGVLSGKAQIDLNLVKNIEPHKEGSPVHDNNSIHVGTGKYDSCCGALKGGLGNLQVVKSLVQIRNML
ncbi:hypothetical protein K435DRAFT_813605 [Dendrothele bispora CBS 962.96]|uniref:Uncharacterized protein n=1 Tax=Dendrothele bispora (strain CBS 962.96) TaxID=1314807 RepID=A0A4S8KL35_DENBC|nr:hypothetical protein K435DRAFT_813605 [Dendrothele bispora CBS 962.96]